VLRLDNRKEWILSVLDVNKKPHRDQVAKEHTTYEYFWHKERPRVNVENCVLVGYRVHLQKPEEKEASYERGLK
jgi:hypothetical protein